MSSQPLQCWSFQWSQKDVVYTLMVFDVTHDNSPFTLLRNLRHGIWPDRESHRPLAGILFYETFSDTQDILSILQDFLMSIGMGLHLDGLGKHEVVFTIQLANHSSDQHWYLGFQCHKCVMKGECG